MKIFYVYNIFLIFYISLQFLIYSTVITVVGLSVTIIYTIIHFCMIIHYTWLTDYRPVNHRQS